MQPKTLISGGDPHARAAVPSKGAFGEEDFLEAPDLARIGKAMIAGLPEFAHLEHWRVRYVWKLKGGKKAGKLTLGTCTKAGGLVKFLGECDFLVAIARDNGVYLTAWQLEALVYHELCHAGEEELEAEDGSPAVVVPVLVGHDAELFGAEIRRYGAWKPDLALVGNAYDQIPLFEEEPTPMRRRAS